MNDQPGPNGSSRRPSGLPPGLVIGTIVVALLAVSGFIFLLYNRTRGPAEVLRDFAEAVDTGDCEAAFDLVDDASREAIAEEEFCGAGLEGLDDELDADFTLERSVYHRETQTADLTVAGSPRPWTLVRHGNTWRVVLGVGE